MNDNCIVFSARTRIPPLRDAAHRSGRNDNSMTMVGLINDYPQDALRHCLFLFELGVPCGPFNWLFLSEFSVPSAALAMRFFC